MPHIMKCDGHLSEGHVERVSIWLPPLNKSVDQCLVQLIGHPKTTQMEKSRGRHHHLQSRCLWLESHHMPEMTRTGVEPEISDVTVVRTELPQIMRNVTPKTSNHTGRNRASILYPRLEQPSAGKVSPDPVVSTSSSISPPCVLVAGAKRASLPAATPTLAEA